MNRPACDCGHAFEVDPRWFHLSSCAYRNSFLYRDDDRFRFTLDGGGFFGAALVIHFGKSFADRLHRADQRWRREARKARGIPAMRAAYRRKKR